MADKNQTVTIELKNDLKITGKLQSVDENLNMQLGDAIVDDIEKTPQLMSCRKLFIRGNVIRYVQMASEDLDID